MARMLGVQAGGTSMIDASMIDDYIEVWNEALLAHQGFADLMNALIKEREVAESRRDMLSRAYFHTRERVMRLEHALMTCAQSAGDDPFFNEGGEGYEVLFGGEEE
jgi:hypothetical protein